MLQCVAVQSLLSLGCKDDLDLRLLATGINFLPLCMSTRGAQQEVFNPAIQVAPAMFEEEEQEQEVTPLKAALEEAVSAAEAQGRSRQPGEATALIALALLCMSCCDFCCAVALSGPICLSYHA